jgi:hypothetical protein
MILKIKGALAENVPPALESLLEGNIPPKYRSQAVFWLVGLYLLGIMGFAIFFNWGNYDMLYHDWANITGPRLQFLRSALREGQFPLHISDAQALQTATTRYLTVADVFISPQYVLLYWLPLPLFELVNVWLLYTLGFVGLLVLRRKLRLSMISFTALFLLFNFNGHILAHYSVGHTTWGGYFLFPWFAWLIFRLLEGDHSWLWTTLISVLLFAIWLQGSYHQFLYLLIMLGLIGIFIPRHFWTVIKTGLITFLVCAFRILPCILTYQLYKQNLINGFPSLWSIWDNLVNIPDWLQTPFYLHQLLGTALGEWELTYFIGLVGGLFLIFFGFYRGLIHRQSPYHALIAPLGVMLLFSLGFVFKAVQALPIPLIQGERAIPRIFSVVLVFGLIIAAERFQRWLDTSPQKALSLTGGLLGLAFIGFDLWQDFRIWQVTNRNHDFWIYFDRLKWYVKNNPSDTIYIGLVFGGLAISILSMLILGGLSWREYRRKKHSLLPLEDKSIQAA